MALDNGSETGSFSRYHLETTSEIKSLHTRVDALEKDVEGHQTKYEKTLEKVSKAEGAITDAIPDLQRRVGDAFDLIGEAGETANVYYSQIRELSQGLEKLQEQMADKASKDALNKKADAGETKAELKNCFLWVKAGFVVVAIAFLLWVLGIWGGFLKIGGAQKPPMNQASPTGVKTP